MRKVIVLFLLIMVILLSSCTSKVETVKDGFPLQMVASTADIYVYKIVIDGYLYIIYDGYNSGGITLAGGQDHK